MTRDNPPHMFEKNIRKLESRRSYCVERVREQKPDIGRFSRTICPSTEFFQARIVIERTVITAGIFARAFIEMKEVVKNGAAYNDGRIQSGDKILAINGQDISNMGQDVVYRILQVC